jgi:hypothetical protein
MNVTLEEEATQADLQGKELPCSMCYAGMPILFSKRRKPYCVCPTCMIQIFFRGKQGIKRLRQLATSGTLISRPTEALSQGVSLFNRLKQLELEKKQLKQKEGIVFTDENVQNAIRIIETEIQNTQNELAKIAHRQNGNQ